MTLPDPTLAREASPSSVAGRSRRSLLVWLVLVAVGTWVLRKQQPDLPRSFVVKGLPIVATLAVVSCLWLMINLTVETWIRFIGWMVLGVIIYFAYSRRNSVLGKRERGEESSVDGPARV